ncbi:MAG: LamG domain-containing protein [Polyangiaceae bacterium]
MTSCMVYDESLLPNKSAVTGDASGGSSGAVNGGSSGQSGAAASSGGDASLNYGGNVSTGNGGAASGGASGTGGAVSKGGTSGNGGTQAAGGVVSASGGAAASGGSVSSGGSVAKGGSVNSGGSVSSGGNVAKGGSVSSGGSASTSGGAVASGGSVSSGGAVASGGATSVLAANIVHRYSFTGTGTTVTDSIGTAHGIVVNTTLSGNGTLPLAGDSSDQYADLPNGIISSLTNATIETWFTWSGGDPWQRVFDFGSSNAGEGKQGSGVTYVFLTPNSPDYHSRATFRVPSISGEVTVAAATTPTDTLTHVALVIDTTNALSSLYVNGAFKSSVAFSGHLSEINDFNNWIGRSQFGDTAYTGSIDELRIYKAALAAKDISASYAAGPNPTFFP